jgi:hypothetical protein
VTFKTSKNLQKKYPLYQKKNQKAQKRKNERPGVYG